MFSAYVFFGWKNLEDQSSWDFFFWGDNNMRSRESQGLVKGIFQKAGLTIQDFGEIWLLMDSYANVSCWTF